MQLSQSREHCLNCQLWALSRQSFKLRYPINEKKPVFFAKYYLLNLDKNKMIVFGVIEKKQKLRFLPSGFLQKSSLQNQKLGFTVKFNPCSCLEVTCFVFIRFPGRATAFCFSSSWPYLDLISTSRLHCLLGNSQNFWHRSFLLPLMFKESKKVFNLILRLSVQFNHD